MVYSKIGGSESWKCDKAGNSYELCKFRCTNQFFGPKGLTNLVVDTFVQENQMRLLQPALLDIK